MISVIKRDVVFKTKDIQKEYDGQVLKDETHDLKELPNLVSNHTYKISGPYGEITNVGEVENTLTVTDILDSSNKSVIDNYNIIYEYGILKVVPRTITIESGSAEKIYDGLALNCEKTSVVDNKLLKGHQYKASGFISVTDAGIYENTFAECYIYDEFNQDVTYNYEIIKYNLLKQSVGDNELDSEWFQIPALTNIEELNVDDFGNVSYHKNNVSLIFLNECEGFFYEKKISKKICRI